MKKKKVDRSEQQAEARLMIGDLKRERSVRIESIGKFFRKRREIPAYREIARSTIRFVRSLDADLRQLSKEAGL